ncbi:acyltransferase [Stieleria sp. TO1_6]|uniref:acyltransferase family protein n=1 Tax=Stieleria tagensis TaxID=2956795 RepID=UPI00209B1887|nr:acyltransferase family protein [Stieleria tagensis]MCO8124141.1 acyltransferase [Stieleria tagensis]
MRAALEYRPAIDGLRAIAIVPVVLFHLNPALLPGGYLGVDVFFVISGYLITRVLLRDLANEKFRMRDFFLRRLRRLAPVILAVVAFCLLSAWIWFTQAQFVFVAKQSLASLLSVFNFFVLSTLGDYWGPAASSTSLLHLWSLSVEEQFYLIYPLLLALVHRYWPQRMTGFLIALAVISGLAYSIVSAVSQPAAFYLLPTRAWELTGGGILASIVSRPPSQRPKTAADLDVRGLLSGNVAGAVALAMIITPYFFSTHNQSSMIGMITVVVGTILMLTNDQSGSDQSGPAVPPNHPSRWLALPALVYVGCISYSWYMWHWPLIVINDLAGFYFSPWSVGLAGFVAAMASYHLIEQPTRRRPGVVRWIAAGFAVVAAVAILGLFPRPTPTIDRDLFATPVWYGSYYNAVKTDTSGQWYQQIMADVRVPQRDGASDAGIEHGILLGTDGSPQVVLFGDSHATMWAHLIADQIRQRDQSLAVWAINGMDPVPLEYSVDAADLDSKGLSNKQRYDMARIKQLRRWKPKLTIVAMRWSWRDPERLPEFIQFVADNSDQVLLIGATPELRIGDQNAIDYLASSGIAPTQENQYLPRALSPKIRDSTALVRRLARSIPNVQYLDLQPLYESESTALVLIGNECLYLDDDHLTEFGAQRAGETFSRVFDQILQ